MEILDGGVGFLEIDRHLVALRRQVGQFVVARRLDAVLQVAAADPDHALVEGLQALGDDLPRRQGIGDDRQSAAEEQEEREQETPVARLAGGLFRRLVQFVEALVEVVSPKQQLT